MFTVLPRVRKLQFYKQGNWGGEAHCHSPPPGENPWQRKTLAIRASTGSVHLVPSSYCEVTSPHLLKPATSPLLQSVFSADVKDSWTKWQSGVSMLIKLNNGKSNMEETTPSGVGKDWYYDAWVHLLRHLLLCIQTQTCSWLLLDAGSKIWQDIKKVRRDF